MISCFLDYVLIVRFCLMIIDIIVHIDYYDLLYSLARSLFLGCEKLDCEKWKTWLWKVKNLIVKSEKPNGESKWDQT